MKKTELEKLFSQKRDSPDYPLHNFHPYPCKFPAFIPRTILKNFAKPGDIIADPFVGSGTTMLEATLIGLSSVGYDINPLSCLLAKVKATPIKEGELHIIDDFISDILSEYKKKKEISLFSYPSINHWFQNNAIRELSFLKIRINAISKNKIRDLLSLILSSIIVRISNQESDTRYAAIDKGIKDLSTIKIFMNKAEEIRKIYSDFYRRTKNFNISTMTYQSDGRDLQKAKNNSVDLIVTSPPYANTYDYYLYHKHRKFWLDMDIQYAQYNEIGSRREYSSLKEHPRKWEKDIEKCLEEMKRITKKNKHIFIIIGDSVINKKLIKMNKMIRKLSNKIGLEHVETVSSPLSNHSKMFNPKFSSPIRKEEHLIHLKND